MSENRLDKLNKKINKIERIGMSTKKLVKNPVKQKEYGSYQHFQSECMQKVDETKPDSPSRIEVILGKEGIHSTERLVECSLLWGKHRNLENPINGLMNDLKTAQKSKESDNNSQSEL